MLVDMAIILTGVIMLTVSNGTTIQVPPACWRLTAGLTSYNRLGHALSTCQILMQGSLRTGGWPHNHASDFNVCSLSV